MANAPDPYAEGTLQIRISSAVSIAAARAFVKVGLGEHTRTSHTVELTNGEHRFSADFLFRGVYGRLTAVPMLVSGWESHAAGHVGLLGEARVDVGALVADMHGIECGVAIGTGQVRPSAPQLDLTRDQLSWAATATAVCCRVSPELRLAECRTAAHHIPLP